MKDREVSPRGRFVRKHPRRHPDKRGKFVVVDAYQEEVDRLSAKPPPQADPQMKLVLPAPGEPEEDDTPDERPGPSAS